MGRHVAQRVLLMVPTLLLVVTLAYVLMRLAPGGPFDQEKPLPPEIRRNIEAKFHHDWPLWKQYVHYLANVARGDLGPSYKYADRTVNEIIAEGLPASLTLAGAALLVAIVLGFAAGIVGAVFRGRWPDRLVMGLALGGLCVPNFVLGPVLVLLFALTLQWLPAARFTSPLHVLLPATALAGAYVAYVARLVRAGLAETIRLDFVRTARAKGLPESLVVIRHALPLGMLPVVSFLGPATVGLMTGGVVVEKLFNVPGLGRYFVDAALNRDYTLAMGIVIVEAVLLLVMNLVVDLLYFVLDPRVRREQA
jgi:oligopeptide transport system permease protein